MDFSKIYNSIGDKFPTGIHKYLETKLRYAGVEANTLIWIGERALLIILFSIAGFMGYLDLDKNYVNALAIFILLLVLFSVLIYINLFFMVVGRTNKVEKSLPDFLMLIVSNLHAGMTPFAAFVQAARPEFGPLYYEVKEAAARVGGKRSLDAALMTLSNRFDSEVFRKTVNLFLKGIKAGGQLGKLLAANAEEIRKIQDLRAELISTTQTYTVFLAFIVVIVMPFLLGVSANFLSTFISIKSQVGVPQDGAKAISIFSGNIGVTPQQMQIIAITALSITCLIASMFMGVVRNGKPLYGLKYYPFLIAAALIFFFITQAIIGNVITLQ